MDSCNSGSFQSSTLCANNAPLQTMARNRKKRSRASRRAPTTVLTTDKSNFRAMVQEFTGVPSPPFTEAQPYIHRPLPQKFQSQFLTPSSNSVGFEQMPFTQSWNLCKFPIQSNQRLPFSNDSYVMGSSEFRNDGGFDEFGYHRNDNNNVENNLVKSVAGEHDDGVNGEGVAESWWM